MKNNIFYSIKRILVDCFQKYKIIIIGSAHILSSIILNCTKLTLFAKLDASQKNQEVVIIGYPCKIITIIFEILLMRKSI